MKLQSVEYGFDLVGSEAKASIMMRVYGGDGNGGVIWSYVIMAPLGYLDEGVDAGFCSERPSERVAERLIETAFLSFRESEKNEKQ